MASKFSRGGGFNPDFLFPRRTRPSGWHFFQPPRQIRLKEDWRKFWQIAPRPPGQALLELLAWLAIAFSFALLVLATLVFYYSVTLPDPRLAGLTKQPPNLTILAADGSFIAERGMRRGYVRYEDLPPHLVNALIATEDRRFRYHLGFDPIGMTRAALRNWSAGEVVEGGSTITQQLAKNLFLKPERTWTRKIEEFLLALWLEVRFTKDQIAELYLNRVYFGAGNYGIGAAAYHYFGKQPKDLTLAECALLVGLIKAPSQYSPMHNLGAARGRTRAVLKNMAESGMVGLEEYGLALARPAGFQTLPSARGFEHLADWIVELVPELVGEVEANLIVETSIDPTIQAAANDAFNNVLRQRGEALNVTQGAVVVMTPDGRVKALIGGRDYQTSQFNRAVMAARQPGSSFKPFIYLTALEGGLTPDSLIEDAPIEIGEWRPRNYAGIYRGPITLRTALAQSSNMAAIRLMYQFGIDRVIKTAQRLGIASRLKPHPTLALGASDVTLLEMTAAYSSFANGGFATVPRVIERIRDENGKVIYERSQAPTHRVIAEKQVADMNALLRGVAEHGTARGAVVPGQLVAAKTGTSQRYRDAWFIGFTPYYVGGVWLGNDDNKPMFRVSGGMLPATIWRLIMTKAHEGLEPKPLLGVPALPPAEPQPKAEMAKAPQLKPQPPLLAKRITVKRPQPQPVPQLAPRQPASQPRGGASNIGVFTTAPRQRGSWQEHSSD